MVEHPGYAALGFDGVDAEADQFLNLPFRPFTQRVPEFLKGHRSPLAINRAAALTKAIASGPL